MHNANTVQYNYSDGQRHTHTTKMQIQSLYTMAEDYKVGPCKKHKC